ncbi:MAG TPA: glycosyltransferase family 4 protein [Polyangiaceae bacterium]
MPARVLFVSKPIVAPFFDGTKCVVRDVATHLARYAPIVMGTALPPGPELAARAGGPAVRVASVYGAGGSYAPSLAENARAAVWLLALSRAEVWHFVFAPNPRTSLTGRLARAVRRVPVLQTVASPPASFSPDLFFGDVVVAQSAFTASHIGRCFRDAGRAPPRVEVIPPPIGHLRERTGDEISRVRRTLDLTQGAPVFVYPGDLEVSRGAETVAEAVGPIVKELPDAVVVFACRPKTADAPRIEQALRSRLNPRSVRFARETDLLALLATTSVVLFPVDDLRGKVDLPIALLEAMKLGVPVVAVDRGPLSELEGVERVPVGDAASLARAATRLVRDTNHRAELVARARTAVERRYEARMVAGAYECLYDDLLRRVPR